MNTGRNFSSLLVTGGCGFIGSAFIRGLFSRLGFAGRVVNVDALTYAGNPESLEGAVDPERYVFVHADIRDRDRLRDVIQHHAVDGIVNFAAESHVDRSIVAPGAFIETNIVGTFELLELLKEHPRVHFHHVSTDEVYGSLGATGAFREDTAYAPNSPYAASKAASDHLVRAYAHTYGLSVTISNSSNNYGPYQFPEKLIPLMILNLFENAPLPVYGDGSNVRDWLHVDDHVEALWAIVCRAPAGETYNIGGNAERTNLEVVRALIRAVADETGRSVSELESLITFVKDRPGHDLRYAIDASKLRRELGFTPSRGVEAGLRQTVSWYARHSAWIERVRSGAYRDWIETNYVDR
ncbi:MAG TPA: dTDP-glucose 4,6-dehydratase [Polyangiaceae bacterium]|nr:dTDP-glucose 4,6-dehydratase [Polyangiaceae bacterium]